MTDDDVTSMRVRAALSSGAQRGAGLADMKALLHKAAPTEATNTIRNVGLVKIFECLNEMDPSHVDLTCEVLEMCFANLTVGDVVKNYTSNIMYLLRHENDSVRKLAVDEIYKTVTADANLLPLPEYVDIFVAIAQLVGEKDIGISNKAMLITSAQDVEKYPQILEALGVALDGDSSSKCNAYEVIVNVSSKSEPLLLLCAKQGYIDTMIRELTSKDILFQLNILELLTRLAVTPHGIRYLVEHEVFRSISDLIITVQSNPLASVLIPGYMRFFGSVAHLFPKEIFDNYPVIVDSLFESLESANQAVLPVALDTLGFVGSTIEGKLSLAAIGARYTAIITKVGEYIRNSPAEIKIRSLNCMAGLIGVDKDPKLPKTGPIDHRVTLMTREWFRSLSEQPSAMETLHGICKNPFPDIRLAAFGLLDAVCQHQWGEEMVARTPGFVEFLLDRSVDHTKESKEAKYDVIKRLSRSAAFDPSVILKMTTYLEQGAFYTEQQLEVALEENN